MSEDAEIPDYGRSGSEDRVPVSSRLPEDVVEQIDERVEEGEFENRSEAIRELLQERIRT